MNKNISPLALFVLLGLLGCNKSQPMQTSGAPTPNASAVPPGNIAAPPEFWQGYDEFKKLRDEINAKEKASDLRVMRLQLQGMVDELNKQIPTGYYPDEATKSFAPQPRPAPPQAPPVPAPAPVPPKKP